MSRIKFVVFSLMAWLSCYCANGQEGKDGFIILTNGDYEYGFIQMDPSLNVHRECLFTVAASKPYTKFTPEQVQGYGLIDGIHFATKAITVDGTVQKHFLKKEIDELVRVYSFQDKRFFVELNGFEELTKSNYKTILEEALKSCKNISVARTKFSPTEMQSLFMRYKRCSDPESVSVPTFQFDILAGIDMNNMTMKGGQAPLGLNPIPLTDKTLVSGGVNVIMSFKKSRRLSVVTGAYYFKQNFYSITQFTTSDYSSTDKINFDYSEVLIPIAFQYSLFKNERRVMPYLKAGISVPITIKSSFVWESEKEYTSTVFFERYDLPQEFKQFLQPTLSIGTTFNLIQKIRNVVEISYFKGGGKVKNDTKSLDINSNRVAVMLGVRF